MYICTSNDKCCESLYAYFGKNTIFNVHEHVILHPRTLVPTKIDELTVLQTDIIL